MNIEQTTVKIADICGLGYTDATGGKLIPYVGYSNEPSPPITKLVPDAALGNYMCDGTNRITVHRGRIRAYVKCKKEIVERVVLIHEIAHSVTHLGLNPIWKNFKNATKEDVEGMAQSASFIYLRDNDPAAVETFKIMSDDSPTEYRIWEKYQDQTNEQFQRALFRISGRMVGKEQQFDIAE